MRSAARRAASCRWRPSRLSATGERGGRPGRRSAATRRPAANASEAGTPRPTVSRSQRAGYHGILVLAEDAPGGRRWRRRAGPPRAPRARPPPRRSGPAWPGSAPGAAARRWATSAAGRRCGPGGATGQRPARAAARPPAARLRASAVDRAPGARWPRSGRRSEACRARRAGRRGTADAGVAEPIEQRLGRQAIRLVQPRHLLGQDHGRGRRRRAPRRAGHRAT